MSNNIPGRMVDYGLQACLANALRANDACAEICTEVYQNKKEVTDYVFDIQLWSMLLTITRAEDDMTLHDLHFFAQNFANNSLNLCWISKNLQDKKLQFVEEFLKYHWPEEEEEEEETKTVPEADYSEVRHYLRSRNVDVSDLLNCLPTGVQDTALSMWRAFCTFGEKLMLNVKVSAYYDDTSDIEAVDEFMYRNTSNRPATSNHHHHHHSHNCKCSPIPSPQMRHSAPPFPSRTPIVQTLQHKKAQRTRGLDSFEPSPSKKKISWFFRRKPTNGTGT